jgi:hypothetical protein
MGVIVIATFMQQERLGRLQKIVDEHGEVLSRSAQTESAIECLGIDITAVVLIVWFARMKTNQEMLPPPLPTQYRK